MARKKHRRNFRDALRRFLIKYGCLALFLPVWLIAPPRYFLPLTSACILLCYGWIEAFNWLEDVKSDLRTKRIKLLARFWRYGFFYLGVALSLLVRSRHFPFAVCALYGAYTLVISLSMCRHFICGMQDASHQPMDPWKRRNPTASYRRDGLLMGVIFVVLGIIGLAAA